MELRVLEAKAAKSALGQSTEEDRATQRALEVSRERLNIQQGTGQHLWVRRLLEVRKEPLKSIRGYSTWCSQRAGNSACSYPPDGRTSLLIHGVVGRVFGKVLHQ